MVVAWHALAAEQVLQTVDSSPDGLTAAEAAVRLARDGRNVISARRPPSWLRKLGGQFLQPLVLVLLGAAVLSMVLGDVVDAAVISTVVVLNGLLGFMQEFRAERAIAALAGTLVTEATVLRDGVPRRRPSAELVRGDVVWLQSGDAVPADMRLLELRDCEVEEAALTGESLPAVKHLGLLSPETGLGDRANMVFAGSSVATGVAQGVVVATGGMTEMGRIAGLMASTPSVETPLTRRIAGLSGLLVRWILGLAGLLLGIEFVRGADLVRSFNAAVALAVGAIPEGLPAAVTVLLAAGVSSLARRGALMRHLPAVETLGSTTIICSDKTGTLTENQMTVTTVWTAGGTYAIEGVGLEPQGQILLAGQPVDVSSAAALRELLLAGALCNDARLVGAGDDLALEGDPTEGAMVVAACKAGFDPSVLADHPRLDEVPFASSHMYMATLHRVHGGHLLCVKGASDALLPRCVDQLRENGSMGPLLHGEGNAVVEALAAKGLRVLVLARRRLPETVERLRHEDVTALTLLGLVGMMDPPRPEARSSVLECQAAGIKIRMITGDHAVTASAIASRVGLEGARDGSGRLVAVTGTQLAAMSLDQLSRIAEDVAVFARVAPEQKLALVRALQARGHVVAMTGDGVNDAPALKQADIGVAMGRNGTDVARAAAAMILTDDRFSTIAEAVHEGRAIHANLAKFITWTLPTNGGEGLVLLTAVAAGASLPVLPVQLLWINLTTALLGTTLIFEPREPGMMRLPPRDPAAPILDRPLALRVLLVSVVVGSVAFGFFSWTKTLGYPDEVARTVALNTIVVVEVGYLFACRSLIQPIWKIGLFANPAMWAGASAMLGLQLALTYLPLLNKLFHTAPVPWGWWPVMTGAGLTVFLVEEIRKVRRRSS
ncbi:MAG: HAD-IC family P-type ATPase [Candidatus Sericytochromatia bacterium]|nr:HAD-IC family P-type ATPase [Candidatus Sericytochromatia bacterium]